MAQPPEPEAHDQPNDADIVRWFEVLEPPREGTASSHLQASVLAKIQQQRARRGLWAWTPQVLSPAWSMALATVLLLSLGLHLWWGLSGFGPRGVEMRRSISPLTAYRLQNKIQDSKALASFITTYPAFLDADTPLGFDPSTARVAFVYIGTLYVETLALVDHGDPETAEQRLAILINVLDRIQAPQALSDYLGEMQEVIRSQRYSTGVSTKFLALFEPLYEDIYIQQDNAEALTLFQLSVWLENVYLAAVSGDTSLLPLQMGQAFRYPLAQLKAPQEAVDVLERLQQLIAHDDIPAPQTIRQLVEKLQGILGLVRQK